MLAISLVITATVASYLGHIFSKVQKKKTSIFCYGVTGLALITFFYMLTQLGS